MPIEDITLRDEEYEDRHGVINKVLRLRAVKDINGKMGGDKLFMDIMLMTENFTTQTLEKIGEAFEFGDSEGVPPRITADEKCIGTFTVDLDEAIMALDLLKKHSL